jgi:hypothetical protein
MNEQPDALKQSVAEIKFLIHDLRVESFINEVIHYHVTVNTDLEIYNIDQAQALHGEDLQELKAKAGQQRKALQDYTNAVKSFSPDRTILAAGRNYVQTIYELCELILNPRWGRAHSVLEFLPKNSRSVRMNPHYMNCIRWICGVYYRIQYFMEEAGEGGLEENFDLADEVEHYVRDVIYGYVTEKSSARVEIEIDRLDPVVVRGNRYRFRRMFFNLVMNAVDGMKDKRSGVLNISEVKEADRAVLRVRDNGAGMTPQKIEQLLADKKNLDGELHSLGFVFVRQTIAQFGGTVSIDSELDEGTTVTVSLPFIEGGIAAPRKPSECENLEQLRGSDEARQLERTAYARKAETGEDDRQKACGEIVFADYKMSDAQFPGSIFAIGVTDDGRIDFFTHRSYERDWNITHEDLSPMFYAATVRGRVEEDEDKTPVLILKAPQNVREYFDFREVAETERNPDTQVRMVHDEYVRIARKLIETGMSPQMGVRLTDVEKFFPMEKQLAERDPFPLEMLAKQRLTSEQDTLHDGSISNTDNASAHFKPKEADS